MRLNSHEFILNEDGSVRPVLTPEDELLFHRQLGDMAVRRVALHADENYTISTVFLGINHGYLREDDEAPVLWETLINDKHGDEEDMYRYTSHLLAQLGHQACCLCYFGYIPEEDDHADQTPIERSDIEEGAVGSTEQNDGDSE